MSDPQVAIPRSRLRSWRLGLLIFSPVALLVAAAFVVQGYVNAVAPYPTSDAETLGDTIQSVGSLAAPALAVFGILALVVRWRLPKLASPERGQRALSIAIFTILSALIGGAAYALFFIVYLVPMIFTECQVHGC